LWRRQGGHEIRKRSQRRTIHHDQARRKSVQNYQRNQQSDLR
jgi:hypothetical protein